MKHFLKRRWHGIPIGLILVFVLIGAVAASYSFLLGSLDLHVDEACIVQVWDGDSWENQVAGFTLTASDAYPGEVITVPIQIINASSATLTVTGTYTLDTYPTGGWGDIAVSGGFSSVLACPNGTTRNDLTLTVANDAPEGDYSFIVNFTRS